MSAEYTVFVPHREEEFPVSLLAEVRVKVVDGYSFTDPKAGDKIMEAVAIAVTKWRDNSESGRVAVHKDFDVTDLADVYEDQDLRKELLNVGIQRLEVTVKTGWGTWWSIGDPLCDDAE